MIPQIAKAELKGTLRVDDHRTCDFRVSFSVGRHDDCDKDPRHRTVTQAKLREILWIHHKVTVFDDAGEVIGRYEGRDVPWPEEKFWDLKIKAYVENQLEAFCDDYNWKEERLSL